MIDIIGKSINRIDAYDKVMGKAIYPQDIYMDNMAYGKLLRSTKPHAYIKVNIKKALKIDGVVKIFTGKDVPYNYHGVIFKDHEVLCKEKVRRVGDPIAFVIAENKQILDDAINAIEVYYDEIEAVFDPEEAMRDDAPRIHEDSKNLMYHYKLRKGNIEEAFKRCDVIYESEYFVPKVDHVFLQPESAVATMENDILIVYTATQYPHYDQEEIACGLRIDKEKVRVINTTIGGAFGGREDITVQIHAALGAYVLNRPVKIVYSREESFLAHSKRHSMKMVYKTGATKDGKVLASKVKLIGDTGAYSSWAINVMRKAGTHAVGPYDIENVWVDSYAVYTNNPFSGAMRGFGATQVCVGYEQQMDELAKKLNIDTAELRRKNALKQFSKTSTNQMLDDYIPIDDCLYEVKKYLEEVSDKYQIKESKNKKIGTGISAMYYGTGYGNGFLDESRAKVVLKEDGKIYLYVGVTEVGQGAKTCMLQIASETLNINIEDIIIVNEDTSTVPDSGTAAASRQTYNTGNAVKNACECLKKKILTYSKDILKLNSEIGLKIDKGFIYVKGDYEKSISIKEIAKIIGSINSEATFIAHSTEVDKETGLGSPYYPYTFGACAVILEIDIDTGEVCILDGLVALDTGKTINPNMVEGQIDGGFAMGIGYTLMEDLKVVNGIIKNNKLSKYVIPTSLDTIDIKKILIESKEDTGPYGAKGIGEPVTIYVAPAILNAINNALNIRVNKIPIIPENLLRLINTNK